MIVFLRFLKPSQVRGIDTEAFLRQQLIASNIHEQAILGYRGLVGNHTYFILADHQPTKIIHIYIINFIPPFRREDTDPSKISAT